MSIEGGAFPVVGCGQGSTATVVPRQPGPPPVSARVIEVAHHEAAHAVCAHVLGDTKYGAAIHEAPDGAVGGLAGPGNISAPPDLERYTMAALTGNWRHLTPREILDDATVTAAGYVGAAIWRGATFNISLRGPDRGMINEMAWQLFGEADYYVVDAFERLAIARARRVIAPRWHLVRAVASALVEKRLLTAAEVEGFFNERTNENEYGNHANAGD